MNEIKVVYKKLRLPVFSLSVVWKEKEGKMR